MPEHHYRDWFRFLTSNLPGRRPAEWFRFVSGALPEDAFHVIRFSGTEGLNTLFSFTIELVSRDAAIDGEKLMSVEAEFVILREKGLPAVFRGFPSRLEQGGHFGEWTYYTVELRPAFWKLTKVTGNNIFLNKTAQEAAAQLLTSQPFFQFRHEFRLMRQYPAQEFAMQYGESLYDYILFRIEEQGAYFYFAPDGDRVIFADTPLSHNEPVAKLVYAPGSGMEFNHRDEVVHAFTLAQTPLPRQVVLRCYDWQDPKRVIVGAAEVSPHGVGDVYLAGENAESQGEADRLAKIRAEELACRSRVFTGMGTAPTLRPGVRFVLEGHYSESFNRDYLVTEITHEGAQESFVTLGLGIPLENSPNHLFYRNSFSCIRTNVPYRPARTAPRAKISGVLRAFVDGAQNKRPEMDEFGRYKLIFPFDVSGRKGGNASCWIRMAGPQTGKDSGMAFPLLPGTEVVVSFIDGNPDRPVITGSLPNGETGSISGRGNVNFSGIRGVGGAQVTMNDTDGDQSVGMSTPGAYISLSGIPKGGPIASTVLTRVGSICSSAALGAAEFTSATKKVGTGYRISHTAGGSTAAVIKSLVDGVFGIADKGLNALSEKASRNVVAGASGIGSSTATMLQSFIASCFDMDSSSSFVKSIKSDTEPFYGVSLSAKEGEADATLQIQPTGMQVLAMALSMLSSMATEVGSATAGGVEVAKDIVERGEHDLELDAKEKELQDLKDKLDTEKKKLEDLKEVTPKDDEAMKAIKEQEDVVKALGYEYTRLRTELWDEFGQFRGWSMAGYYINTIHKAVRDMAVPAVTDCLPTLVALITTIKGYCASPKRGGVSISSKEYNVNIRAEGGPVSLHSPKGILLETKLGDDDAAKWGVEGLVNPQGQLHDIWPDDNDPDKPGDKFVVANTDTLGLFAKKIRMQAAGDGADLVSVAPTHTLKSSSEQEPKAQLEVRESEGQDADKEPVGIAAKVTGAGTILLQRAGDKGEEIKIASGDIVLQGGGEKGTHLKLTHDEAELKTGTKGITLEVPSGKSVMIKVGGTEAFVFEQEVLQGNVGKLELKKVTINGAEIKADGALQLQGNALKVMK